MLHNNISGALKSRLLLIPQGFHPSAALHTRPLKPLFTLTFAKESVCIVCMYTLSKAVCSHHTRYLGGIGEKEL